jgi:ribonuclease VapC
VIVDTSAIMAMLLEEPEADEMLRLMVTAPTRRMSAGTWVELGTVLVRRRDPELSRRAERILPGLRIDLVPVTVAQAALGRQGYREYGRGSDHPAQLNLGDCFSYALAKETGEPLLFKGDDFTHTDVTRAA